MKGQGTDSGNHGLEVYAVWANINSSGNGSGCLVQIKARCDLQSCQSFLVNNMAELKGKILNSNHFELFSSQIQFGIYTSFVSARA